MKFIKRSQKGYYQDFNKPNKEIFVSVKEIHLEMVNGDLSVLVPLDIKTKSGSEEEQLGKEILKFYTNQDSLSWDVMKGYLDVRFKSLLFILLITKRYII